VQSDKDRLSSSRYGLSEVRTTLFVGLRMPRHALSLAELS